MALLDLRLRSFWIAVNCSSEIITGGSYCKATLSFADICNEKTKNNLNHAFPRQSKSDLVLSVRPGILYSNEYFILPCQHDVAILWYNNAARTSQWVVNIWQTKNEISVGIEVANHRTGGLIVEQFVAPNGRIINTPKGRIMTYRLSEDENRLIEQNLPSVEY